MNYCALDDAFPSVRGAPSPGCAADEAAKSARKEERRKARRCKAAYLPLEDPDRPSQRISSVPSMNPSTGLTEHVPVTAPQGTTESYAHRQQDKDASDQHQPNFDKDPLYDYLKSEMSNHILPVHAPTFETMQEPPKSFFGADPDSDAFADYVPDAADYRLQPDFNKAFEHAGVARAGATETLPNPSVNMYWKPLTTAGAQTAFVEHLPPPGGRYQRGDPSMDEVMKKMDRLFARLDDMNSSSPEQVTSELLMFISSGIFVLFFMDLLVKKGSTLRF